MKLYKVTDPEFKPYGKVLEDPAYKAIIDVLKTKEVPTDSVLYVPGDPEMEALPEAKVMQTKGYGELPIQIGYCCGCNTKLNALEYHRSSELNFAAEDGVLLLGLQQDITDDYTYDTSKVMAFLVPEGTVIEVYATTLHYAPCNAPGHSTFNMGVTLPKGTNLDLTEKHACCGEDSHLTAVNKWLLGHPEGGLGEGAPMGLIGVNTDVAEGYED